jgi:hypothetical protein
MPRRVPAEQDDFSLNHHPALTFCLNMIFFRKLVPTFRDHALIFALSLAVLASSNLHAEAQTARPLDYEFFKTRVEPIFLAKRPGYARCYVCHAEGNNAFHLEKLAPDARMWNEEQSRLNFAMAAKLVNPGDPDTSRLLLHPLAPEAGGDVFHSGGRQFLSKQDTAWRTLAAWINGATLSAPRPR